MNKRPYNRKNHKDNIGIYKEMNCGLKAKIIEYNSYGDITIEFEDGYRTKTKCSEFEKGIVKNKNVQYSYTKNRLGKTKTMNNGQIATIIRYNYCDDIDIQFEDGTIKTTTYGKFNQGRVKNPNINNSPTKNRIEEEMLNNQGSLMKIIEYINCDDIIVEFQDNHKAKIHTSYGHFKNGEVINPYYPIKFGVGYLGNSSAMDDNGKYKTSYKQWSNMLRRCYFDNRKCYKNVFVCDEWLCFENFEKWHLDNYKKYRIKMCLDKDILSYRNRVQKIYSPKTCSFVPMEINSTFRPNENINEEKCELYKDLANKYKDYISKDVFDTLFNY